MRKFVLALLAFSIWLTALTQPNPVAVTNVNVIDIQSGKIKKAQTVIIEGNKIVSVNDKNTFPKTASVINGSGKFLIPGLWDMHAHVFTDRTLQWLFPLLIANGITGVRDMATVLSYDSIHLVKKQIAEGKLLGPRNGATTQRIFDGPGGPSTIPSLTIATTDQARESVRTHKQHGIDFIKVYNSLSREVFLAIFDEAKQQKIPVAGHVPFAMTAAEVSDLGQTSIEHNTDLFFSTSSEETKLRNDLEKLPKPVPPVAKQPIELRAMETLDEKKAEALFRKFMKNKTWVCPTLVIFPRILKLDEELATDDRLKYMPTRFRQQWSNQIKQRDRNNKLTPDQLKTFVDKNLQIVGSMHRAGVGILAGSDMMNPYLIPGFSMHDELELMVQAGLSPLQALQTATINAAKFLGREKEIGSVEKGKLADLVLLDANPLENISNTKKIHAVIANGKVYQRSDLDKLLMQVIEFAKK